MTSLTARSAPLAFAASIAVLAVLPPLAAAQDAQPGSVPAEFSNGQSNAFGRIAMEPYVEADGEPVPVEAQITLLDRDLLARTTNLLVAFNLQSKDAVVTRTRLTADGQTLEPASEATVRGGLQRQQFFDPADVLAASEGDAIEMRLSGLATAAADGQWHIGVLVIAFDSVWGTLRTADGGAAELYGFSVLMEHGAGGSFLAPFHGQGNEAVLLVPLFVAVLGSATGGWLLFRVARDRYGPHPPGTHGDPLSFAPAPSPAAAPSAIETVVTARPLPRRPRPPQRQSASEAALWPMEFGYRLAADGAPPATVPTTAPPVAPAPPPPTPPPPDGPRLPVQGPRLPAGMVAGPWRPTVLSDPAQDPSAASAGKEKARAKAGATPTRRRSRPAATSRKAGQAESSAADQAPAPQARQGNR